MSDHRERLERIRAVLRRAETSGLCDTCGVCATKPGHDDGSGMLDGQPCPLPAALADVEALLERDPADQAAMDIIRRAAAMLDDPGHRDRMKELRHDDPRASIVAWLRETQGTSGDTWNLHMVADMIERGDDRP
jgi:hypothetical protein